MRRIISFLLMLPLAVQALDIEVQTGYDDNPFEMKVPDSGAAFVRAAVKHAGRTAGQSHLQYSLDINSSRSELVEADSTQARGRVRWVQRGQLFSRSVSVLATVDAGTRRDTYVDQLTGRIGRTREGDEIGERYSFDFGKFSLEGILRFNRNNYLALYGYLETPGNCCG